MEYDYRIVLKPEDIMNSWMPLSSFALITLTGEKFEALSKFKSLKLKSYEFRLSKSVFFLSLFVLNSDILLPWFESGD